MKIRFFFHERTQGAQGAGSRVVHPPKNLRNKIKNGPMFAGVWQTFELLFF